jgi:hypothetical protein
MGTRTKEIASAPNPGNMSTPPMGTQGGGRTGECVGSPSPSRMTTPFMGTQPGGGTRYGEADGPRPGR